jgi:hypothetical protein
MARRILSHKALRADFDAAERRKKETQGEGEDQQEEKDEEEEEGAEGAEAEGGEEGEEKAPAKKAKKKPAKAPKEPKKRTRTPKIIRQRVVWGVFNNSNARVQTFLYPQKQEAEDYAKKMMADKGSTFFVQPVKEPIEEKKE